jgi:hypothetical protein
MSKFFLELFSIVGVLFLFLSITFGIWIYFRGTQPLELPDARGITFWQLVRERWGAWYNVSRSVATQPQYSGCRNTVLTLFFVNLRSAYDFTYASLAPNSKLAQAFRFWDEQQPDLVLPKLETIEWRQAPDTFWKYFSLSYWRGLVTADSLAGQCQLGPVNYEAILGVSK